MHPYHEVKQWIFIAILLVIPSLFAAGCMPSEQETPVLTVMTHDFFAASEEVIRAFEEAHHVEVVFLKSGDAGAALNRAILSKENPLADVFYGVDNTFLARVLEAGIFVPYASPMLDKIPDAFELDPAHQALPVDYGDVCINYDKDYFLAKDLALPQSLQDLLKPDYRGLLVVENPATSSPGLAFLLATVSEYGEDGYLDYWRQLRENEVFVVNDWNTAYYTNFSGSSGKGAEPLVVSYASSPVAEVIFASEPLEELPTASIVAAGTCFRQVEFVGILKGTENRLLAEAFVDFMLSVTFQNDMPEQMFVYPVNQDAVTPDSFVQHAQVPAQPVMLDPIVISQSRERWIDAWTEMVLK